MAHIYPYFLPILCQMIPETDIFLDYTKVGLLSMTSLLVMIPLTVLFGFLGDKIRKWRFELIIAGYILVLSHTFVIFVAKSFSVLIIAAVMGGIGASVFHPIALPLLSQEFGAERNYAHSINLIFGTVGSIATPIAAIGLSAWLGWRSATLIFGIFGVICLPIIVVLLLLAKKSLQYKIDESVVLGEKVVVKKANGKTKTKWKFTASFLTAPLIVLMIAQVFRAGIFRIMNTFTSFIFEDRFGTTKFNSALIMALIIASGGISTFISGFVSTRIGSMKTYLFSNIASTSAVALIIIFIGTLEIKNITIYGIGLLVGAIILFVLLAASYYHGDPSANSLLAEMIPLEVLSTVNGIRQAIVIGVASLAPVAFGAIVDKGYSLPYEYLILMLLSIIPLAMLFYVKSKIGFKTPKQVEDERAMAELEKNGVIHLKPLDELEKH